MLDLLNSELVVPILSALVLAAAGALGYGLKRLISILLDYLEARLGAEQLGYVKESAAMVVRALEQSPVYQHFDGAAKKEQALLRIQELAAAQGINLSHEQLDQLLEEAVQRMNAELAKP